MELNVKNFASLNNFNTPSLVASAKKSDDKRSTAHQSPATKLRKSKSKGKAMSKEKGKA